MHCMKLVFLAVLCLADAVQVAKNSVKQEPMPKVDPKDFAIVVTGVGSDNQKISPTTTTKLMALQPAINSRNETYPALAAGNYYVKSSEHEVAGASRIDPSKRKSDGVNEPVKVFGIPEPQRHPMETKTPLIDFRPCNSDRILKVEVLSAEGQVGHKYPTLPPRYGCSARDASREKASPAIKVSNFTANEVDAFSLQMISMGDQSCEGPGATTYNIVQWHVTDIKPKWKTGTETELVLQEGASHDRRTLFGGREQPNQWLEEYYSGPCPPYDTTECFRVKVLAHLHDGSTCFCGHQDVLFYRDEKPVAAQAWAYTPTQLAPVGKK